MKKKEIGPIYTFETVDPLSVRKFSPALPQKEESLFSRVEKESISSYSDDLLFEFAPTALFTNVRLFEPIEVLDLSPFLYSKVKSASIDTIEELLRYTSLGSNLDSKKIAHKERLFSDSLSLELYKKAEEYSLHGRPLVPWIEWDKIASIIRLSQETGKLKSQLQITEKTAKKIMKKVEDVLDSLFKTHVTPWILEQGGVITQEELFHFYCVRSSPHIVHRSGFLQDLMSIAAFFHEPFLFSSRLLSTPFESYEIPIYCLNEKMSTRASLIYETLKELTAKIKRVYNSTEEIHSISSMILKILMKQWENCDENLIRRIIVWVDAENKRP